MAKGKGCLLVGLSAALWCSGVYASESSAPPLEKLPLYEYGIVGLGATIPHYTGSDEYQVYAFPTPYFVYRGEVLKADREGIRGIFWQSKRVEMDISMSGNPPAGDNKAREGMDDLNALGEIGPAINFYFYEYGERDSLFLQADLRAAFSFDFEDGLDMGYEGYVSDLTLIYRESRVFKEEKIRFHLSTGIRLADAEMHSYFYDVARDEITANRQYYKADGGYSGLQLSGSITKELTSSFWVSAYGRWINSNGAVFEDSPLVDTHNNYIVGAMLVWKWGESETLEP